MQNKILFVLCLLMGLNYINAGLNKFFNYIPMPEEMPQQAMEMFVAMTQIPWLMPMIAIFEIIGGVLIIIPRFRALGAVILTPILAGILAHHFVLVTGIPIVLIIAAIHIWVVVENKDKYLPMIRG